jgi:hypothetical protein
VELDDQLNHLEVKLEAVESVHAFLLGMIVQLLPIELNTVLTELTKNITSRRQSKMTVFSQSSAHKMQSIRLKPQLKNLASIAGRLTRSSSALPRCMGRSSSIGASGDW